MFSHSRTNPATTVFLLAFLPAVLGAAEQKPSFTFGQVDLKLLEECAAIERQFEKRGLVYSDPELANHLASLTKGLLPESTPERVEWRFRVIRDPLVNAFALPNGSIYVNTGLLALLENDDQLAGVLAHEITHVLNRHTYQAYRSYRKKMVALHVLVAATSWAPTGTVWGATISVVGSISQAVLVSTIFGYSRELEKEADVYAVEKMRQTGRDPSEMVKTFKLLEEKLEAEPVQTFYRDHPKLEERIAYTNNLVGAKAGRSSSEAGSAQKSAYLDRMENVIRHGIQMDIDSRRFRTAVARAQRVVDSDPKDPENVFCLAEAYRELGPRTAQPSQKELSGGGQRQARKRLSNRTIEEEDKELSSKPEGKAAWAANQAQAEKLYQQVLEMAPSVSKAHRGLGMVYEEQGKSSQAVVEYRQYLELSPEAPDKLRVQRRMEALDKKLKPPAD
jgi:Zn-dependent protease with chaperone function